MNASVRWTQNEQFIGIAPSGHAVVLDAGKPSSAASPLEVVLIGLCACTATDVVSILQKKREPFTSIEVHAETERAPDYPRVFTAIRLIFTIGGNVTRKAAEDAVRLSQDKYCSVSAMLRHSAAITTEIRLPDAEA